MLNFQVPDYQFMENSNIFLHPFTNYKAKTTDLAILLGGYCYDKKYGEYCITINDYRLNSEINNRPTMASFGGDLCYIPEEYYKNRIKNIGIRPVIPFNEIENECKIINEKNEILEVEYGVYPQQAVEEQKQKLLEYIYRIEYIEKIPAKYNVKNLKIKTTNKKYSIDYNFRNNCFYSYPEFEYEGKKYIRISCDIYNRNALDLNYIELTNNYKCNHNQYIWIEVQPIKWLVDKKYNIAIAEKILVAGIPMEKEWKKENFNKSLIKKFMDDHLSTDIIPSKIKEELNINLQPEIRNPKIIEAAIEYKQGMNITIKLPKEIINNIEQINIESLEDSNKQFTYIKKR